MGHYKSNIRDLEFNLFEVFNIQGYLGSGAFEQSDTDTVRGVLSELNALATGPLADSFADGDREQAGFDPATHSVTLPETFRKSYQQVCDGEWWRLSLPDELGGYGVPPSVRWAAAELILGANPAIFMYMCGPSFATVAWYNGTEEQRHWAELVIERGWGATMVLTEPDAGSDVGAGRTKAVRQEDGSWHLDGVKRFITSGDQDLTENIMHFVLARPVGPDGESKPGTKGLSLFLVPKFHFDPNTGELGERNGVFVTNVEHKMGLNASATCELTFGQHGVPARGWLLGEVHDGIAQMFQVIEHARMMVGTKAIGTLSTGYLNALAYAKERVQGADLTRATDKTAPRVTITNHPDIRRILMLQKAYAEGLRAVYLYTATFQDQVARGGGEDVSLAEQVNDLLLPIVKGVGSERAYEMLALSLQTLGGSGYLKDYPIEQYLRDAKIDSLYEGTTAIQAQDFFFRKIVRNNGQALGHVAAQIQQWLQDNDDERLKEERALVAEALENAQGMLNAMIGFLMSAQEDVDNIYKVGQHAVTLLMSIGDLLVGWLLLRQAAVALAALDAEATAKDQPFYQGKIGAARFFAKQVLPELRSRRAIIEAADNALMELDESAF